MFDPPANLNDFARRPGQEGALRQRWHEFINNQMTSNPQRTPVFYDPLNPPVADAPVTAAPVWTGLPQTAKRLRPESILAAAQLVEDSIPMGGRDPLRPTSGRFTPPFLDDQNRTFTGPRYRPQDEYLEWVTRRDSDGVIVEIMFTCEGPEYWSEGVASDPPLLLDMYRELAGDNQVQMSDLVFPRAVSWRNPNNGLQRFPAGAYNPFNRLNIEAAVHLTHPANTLGAEIALGRSASRLFGNPTPVTTDPALVCCGGYGDVNRMSDPAIGAAVNSEVRSGRRVTLRNPVGLYMRSIDAQAFTLPDGTPFSEAEQCFEPLRPQGGGEMIVRARFRVPNGMRINGRQLRVGDLLVNDEQIVTGGQVAETITMRLFAQTLPGAPAQQRERCSGRPCPDPSFPDLIQVIPFNQRCPGQPAAGPPMAAAVRAALESVSPAAPRARFILPTGRMASQLEPDWNFEETESE